MLEIANTATQQAESNKKKKKAKYEIIKKEFDSKKTDHFFAFSTDESDKELKENHRLSKYYYENALEEF